MICQGCKEDKCVSSFPPGYKMICAVCYANRHGKIAKIAENVDDVYEEIVKYRTQDEMLERQDELWDNFNDLDLDADLTSFTKSNECDDMMQNYEDDLVKVLSGLEENLPDWYGIEIEEEE